MRVAIRAGYLSTIKIIAAFLVYMLPSASIADEGYLFVKIACHPESKSASVHVFTEWNDAGRALLKHHDKNVYPVVDDKVRTCDLGNKQEVEVGPSYTVPIGNSQHIFIGSTHMGIIGLPVRYYLDWAEPWDVDYKPLGNGNFSGRYCSNYWANFKPEIQQKFADQFKRHKRICELVEGAHTTYEVDGIKP